MPNIVHSRAVRALHMSESVFIIRCIAHDSHLVTKSVLPNSVSGLTLTLLKRTLRIFLNYVMLRLAMNHRYAKITVLTPNSLHLHTPLLVYIEFFPLAHKTGTTLRS
jgi:hypothetical protein